MTELFTKEEIPQTLERIIRTTGHQVSVDPSH